MRLGRWVAQSPGSAWSRQLASQREGLSVLQFLLYRLPGPAVSPCHSRHVA